MGGKLSLAFAVIAALMLFAVAHAAGIGTSSISFSSANLTVAAGGSANVGYTVSLASGSTWGTSLVLSNKAALAAQGITVTMSNPAADPPFSGTLTVSAASSASAGNYQLEFAATGDDPSASSMMLTVAVSAAVPGGTTTVAYGTGGSYSYPASAGLWALAAAVLIILIISAYAMSRMVSMPAKTIIVGIALILIGTAVWLYGDYTAMSGYAWAGVIAILLGTVIWIYGDAKGGMFTMKGGK